MSCSGLRSNSWWYQVLLSPPWFEVKKSRWSKKSIRLVFEGERNSLIGHLSPLKVRQYLFIFTPLNILPCWLCFCVPFHWQLMFNHSRMKQGIVHNNCGFCRNEFKQVLKKFKYCQANIHQLYQSYRHLYFHLNINLFLFKLFVMLGLRSGLEPSLVMGPRPHPLQNR